MQNFADVVKQKQSTNVIYAFVPSASISVWIEDCLEDFLEVAAPLSDEPLLAELAGPLQYIQRLHCPKNKLNLRMKTEQMLRLLCTHITSSETWHIPLHLAPTVAGSVFVQRFRIFWGQCDPFRLHTVVFAKVNNVMGLACT